MVEKRTMSHLARVLKALPREELEEIGRARGVSEDNRLDLEYGLLRLQGEDRAALVAAVVAMVARLLVREAKFGDG